MLSHPHFCHLFSAMTSHATLAMNIQGIFLDQSSAECRLNNIHNSTSLAHSETQKCNGRLYRKPHTGQVNQVLQIRTSESMCQPQTSQRCKKTDNLGAVQHFRKRTEKLRHSVVVKVFRINEAKKPQQLRSFIKMVFKASVKNFAKVLTNLIFNGFFLVAVRSVRVNLRKLFADVQNVGQCQPLFNAFSNFVCLFIIIFIN